MRIVVRVQGNEIVRAVRGILDGSQGVLLRGARVGQAPRARRGGVRGTSRGGA
jgi:hypothetical protein